MKISNPNLRIALFSSIVIPSVLKRLQYSIKTFSGDSTSTKLICSLSDVLSDFCNCLSSFKFRGLWSFNTNEGMTNFSRLLSKWKLFSDTKYSDKII